VSQSGVYAEEDCVTQAGICDRIERALVADAPKFSHAPGIVGSAQVYAHCNLPVLPHVAVPGIMVAGARHHSIDATYKASERSAFGELLNHGQELGIVCHELERRR
jgi:hypothetical protein